MTVQIKSSIEQNGELALVSVLLRVAVLLLLPGFLPYAFAGETERFGQTKPAAAWAGWKLTPGSGHTGLINSVAFSPEPSGRTFLSAGWYGELILWDRISGRPLRRFTVPDRHRPDMDGRGMGFVVACFSPDGRRVLSGQSDGKLREWWADSGELYRTVQTGLKDIHSVSYSPDGRLLVAAGEGPMVELMSVASGQLLAGWKAHQVGVSKVLFGPRGRMIATAGKDRMIRLWESRQGRQIAQFGGFKYGVGGLAISPDGRLIAGGGIEVRVFDIRSGRLVGVLKGDGRHILEGLKFSPDGRFLLAAGGKIIRLWDMLTGRLVKSYVNHRIGVQSVDFSGNGKLIVSGGLDKRVHLWSSGSGKLLRVHRFHNEHLMSLALSPDGHFLAAAGEGRLVRIWDLQTGRLARIMKGHKGLVYHVSYSSNGHYLLSAGNDGKVMLWQAGTGLLLRSFDNGSKAPVLSARFSRDGAKVIANVMGVEKTWDRFTGQLVKTERLPAEWLARLSRKRQEGETLKVSSDQWEIQARNNMIVVRSKKTGRERMRFYSLTSRRWFALRPDGIYSGSLEELDRKKSKLLKRQVFASRDVHDRLSLVRGYEAVEVPQEYKTRFFRRGGLFAVRGH